VLSTRYHTRLGTCMRSTRTSSCTQAGKAMKAQRATFGAARLCVRWGRPCACLQQACKGLGCHSEAAWHLERASS